MERYRDAYSTRNIEQVRLIEGQSFALGVVRDFSNPLPAGQSIDIAIAFPEGMNPVFEMKGLSNGNAVGYLYENASVTGGTALTPINKNRASTIISKGVALLNPTVNSTGTLILNEILTGGVGKKGAGGATGGNVILKGLTSYLFRLTNQDQNNNAHAMEVILTWIE